jgi:hypothetical protein
MPPIGFCPQSDPATPERSAEPAAHAQWTFYRPISPFLTGGEAAA